MLYSRFGEDFACLLRAFAGHTGPTAKELGEPLAAGTGEVADPDIGEPSSARHTHHVPAIAILFCMDLDVVRCNRVVELLAHAVILPDVRMTVIENPAGARATPAIRKVHLHTTLGLRSGPQ